MFKDFQAAQAKKEAAKASRNKKLIILSLMAGSFILGWNHLWMQPAATEKPVEPSQIVSNATHTGAAVDATAVAQTGANNVIATTENTVPAQTVATPANPNQVSISLELPKPEPVVTAAPVTTNGSISENTSEMSQPTTESTSPVMPKAPELPEGQE